MTDDTNILHEELETFESKRDELVKGHNGKYVIIKGDEILGIFDTEMDAVNVGYDRLGLTPFLVKEITPIDSPQYYTPGLLEL